MEQTEEMKCCKRCNQTLHMDKFGINKRFKDGHNSACKTCQADYQRSWVAKRGEQPERSLNEPAERNKIRVLSAALLQVGAKCCGKCGAVKPVEAFNKDKYRPDGFTRLCKECVKTYFQTYYAANREQNIEHVKQYQRDVQTGKRQKRPGIEQTNILSFVPDKPRPLVGKSRGDLLGELFLRSCDSNPSNDR